MAGVSFWLIMGNSLSTVVMTLDSEARSSWAARAMVRSSARSASSSRTKTSKPSIRVTEAPNFSPAMVSVR